MEPTLSEFINVSLEPEKRGDERGLAEHGPRA